MDDAEEGGEEDPRWRTVVDASAIYEREGGPLRPNLYSLGPFASRVSFSSQQLRALNLVWSLERLRLIRRRQHVAVIGAGLAGLTAAAGLIALGCRVTVFESANGVLSRQRNTLHRMAHPSINWWPERPLALTTELPFLDWYAGIAHDIAATVREQWEAIAAADTVRDRTRVIDIRNTPAGAVAVIPEPPAEKETFDAAIMAIGFGDERDGEDGFKAVDYWVDDGWEGRRDRIPDQTFVVSGCGDGGLIDTLRVVHLDFRNGRLALEVAMALNGSAIADRIAQAEGTPDPQPDDLARCYTQCAKELIENPLHVELNERLKRSIREAHATVRLVDRKYAAPFAPTAAPVHKLLVAHAMEIGAVFYSTDIVRRAGVGSKRSVRAKIAVGNEEFPATTAVRVRHGADPNFGGLLNALEVGDLKRRQDVLNRHHAHPIWPRGGFPPAPGQPRQDPTSDEFVESRLKYAKAAIRLLSGNARLWRRSGGYAVAIDEGLPWMPDHLFSVPLSPEPPIREDKLVN